MSTARNLPADTKHDRQSAFSESSRAPRKRSSHLGWRRLGMLVVGSIAAGFALWGYANGIKNSIARCELECRAASKQKQWDQLAIAADRWTTLAPHAPDAWLFCAEAAEEQKDWARLIASLNHVPRTDARFLGVLVRKGIAEFEQLNRPFEGLRTCDAILATDPRVLLAHKQAIYFCAMTLQRREMVRRIRGAIRLGRESPDSYVFLASVSWSISDSLYQCNTKWLMTDPNNEILVVAQAMPVYNSQAKQDLEAAPEFRHIPDGETLLEKYPRNGELIAYFLDKAIANGELDRVQALLGRIPPPEQDTDARFLRARAWVHDTLGDPAEAEQALKLALSLDPYWWQLHFDIHELLRRQNRTAESTDFLQKYQLARELGMTVRGIKHFDASFEDPKFSKLMLNLAELVHDDEVANGLRKRIERVPE